MSLGIYYIIRHKVSGEIMPALDRNRGYSWWNPSNSNGVNPKKILGIPRLLKSRKQAQKVISQWNAMPNAIYHSHQTYYGEYDDDIKIKPDGRTKEDLEIIEVLIEEVKNETNENRSTD